MSTLILDKVLSGYNLAKVNDNFERIEKAFNEALLHRDGSKELLDDLDVNSQKLLNVGGIEIGGVDIVESIASLQEEYNAYISTMDEYKAAVDEILEEAISYGAVDQKSIGNAQRVFTTSQTYAINSNMTLPLPYIVGKNTLKLNLGHYYELYKGVDYEEVGIVGNQSTTIKLLRTISSGVEIEEFVDGDNDLYSIYATAEALQELLTTSYSPESIEEFVNSVSDIQELGLEDKIAQLNSLYDSLVSLQTDLQTTVADINTKYSTITDMYEDVGTKYSLLETLYPQLLALLADTDFDLDGLNEAVGELNTAISDLNDLAPVIEEYKNDAETAATSAESSASSASTSATSAANSASSAAGSLTNAQIWAEGTDGQVETLGGEHSSKGWAEQAREYVSEITSDSEVVATGSTESRALADRFADIINVKDFGAKGDGVTDDTAAFRAAALSKGEGTLEEPIEICVYIPRGIYYLSENPLPTRSYYDGKHYITWIISPDAKIIGNGKLRHRVLNQGQYTTDWYGEWQMQEGGRSFKSTNGAKLCIQTVDDPIEYTAGLFAIRTKGQNVNRDTTAIYASAIGDCDNTHLNDDDELVRNRMWALYAEGARLRENEGAAYGAEIDVINGTGILNPVTPFGHNQKQAVAVLIGCGAEYKDLNHGPSSAAIQIAGAPNTSTNGVNQHDIGINIMYRSLLGCIGGSGGSGMGKAVAMATRHAICWYASANSIANYIVSYGETPEGTTNLIFNEGSTEFSTSSNTPFKLDFDSNVDYGVGIFAKSSDGHPVIAPINKNSADTNLELKGFGAGVLELGAANLKGVQTSALSRTLMCSKATGETFVAVAERTDLPLKISFGIGSGSAGVHGIFNHTTNAWLLNHSGTTTVIDTKLRISSTNVEPYTDNSHGLGKSSLRWKEVFAATGTINTSDERLKSNITDISDDVLDAWGDVNLIVFQFKDAIEKKGEDARIHTGVIAQHVQSAFEAHGLDAFRYGLLCYDEWDDEFEDIEIIDKEAVLDNDGNEIEPAVIHTEQRQVQEAGDRYSIRYEEALILEAAYQRRRADRIESRLKAIEEKMA